MILAALVGLVMASCWVCLHLRTASAMNVDVSAPAHLSWRGARSAECGVLIKVPKQWIPADADGPLPASREFRQKLLEVRVVNRGTFLK